MVSECARRGRPRAPPPGAAAPAPPPPTPPPPPPHLVERRNARERRRVLAVNCAFARLRRLVAGTTAGGRRVSKVRTLRRAIDYIRQLQHQLQLPLPLPAPGSYPDTSAPPWARLADCSELQTSDKENSTSDHQLPSPQLPQFQYSIPQQEDDDTDKVCAVGSYLDGLLLRTCCHQGAPLAGT